MGNIIGGVLAVILSTSAYATGTWLTSDRVGNTNEAAPTAEPVIIVGLSPDHCAKLDGRMVKTIVGEMIARGCFAVLPLDKAK